VRVPIAAFNFPDVLAVRQALGAAIPPLAQPWHLVRGFLTTTWFDAPTSPTRPPSSPGPLPAIGLEIARQLAARQHDLVLTARSVDKLHDLFADPIANKRRTIFVETSFFSDPLAHLTRLFGIGPKYDTPAKLIGLEEILQETGEQSVTALPDSIGTGRHGRKPQFVFCSFGYDQNRAAFFRSDSASLAGSFAPHPDVTLAQAIHASTNAPVNYFDAPAEVGDRRYWDGAIGGYNNPVLAGVIEAAANADRYGTSLPEIKALSLGTGSVVLPVEQNVPGEDPALVQHKAEATLLRDLGKLATSILDDPPDAASFHAHVLLGGLIPANPAQIVATGPIVRMSPLVQPVPGAAGRPWDLPPGLTRLEFTQLCDLDMDAIEQSQVELIGTLARGWLDDKVLNQPIRANSKTLEVEIGQRWYRDAKAQARGLGLI